MKLVDAHVHLSDDEYADCLDDLVTDAKTACVAGMVSNSTNLESSQKSLQLAGKYPKLVLAALGIHPWNVNVLKEGELQATLQLIQAQAQEGNVTAVGEIGLDIKYERIWEKQMMVFTEMLRIAEKLALPVIIHSRGTTGRIVELLPSYNLPRVLLHWFSYPLNSLREAISHGYSITEGPAATYSNGIREVIAQVPLTNLMTETDGPVKYYRPPFNGQMTKPSHIRSVLEAIAEIKKLPLNDVADQIATNFETFFKVKLV